MKIYFNGWYSGFFEKTNPGLHVQFFLDLFKKVYNEECQVGTLEESSILCEFCMLIQTNTKLKEKKWKHTFLYSGESDLRKCESLKNEYDCVLCMERNHKNVVNVPLHIAYIYTNNFKERLETKQNRNNFPPNDVLAIISNPNGKDRNKFLEKLERKMKVSYAGRYKNNVGRIPWDYNTGKFNNFVSQFKFIISMENTRYDTGITEKIVHGMIAQTVPIYWGSERVNQYFNPERFLNLKQTDEETMNDIINKIVEIKNSKEKWLNMVNKKVFPENGKLWRTIENIAKDIRCCLSKNKWNNVEKTYILSNKVFEPKRYERLNNLFLNKLKMDASFFDFICPTYKQTIDDAMLKKYVKKDYILNLRPRVPTKKSELSLVLNYREVLRNIEKNYKDGIFCVFESDVYPLKNVDKVDEFFEIAYKNKNNWDVIHFGYGGENQVWNKPFFNWANSPYRKINEYPKELYNISHQKRDKNKFYIEDFTNEKSKVRLLRHFSTRCTDTLLWSYNGVKKMLKCMEDENFIALDYYFTNKFEKNINLKHYWTDKNYFLQGSNYNIEKSTIQ